MQADKNILRKVGAIIQVGICAGFSHRDKCYFLTKPEKQQNSRHLHLLGEDNVKNQPHREHFNKTSACAVSWLFTGVHNSQSSPKYTEINIFYNIKLYQLAQFLLVHLKTWRNQKRSQSSRCAVHPFLPPLSSSKEHQKWKTQSPDLTQKKNFRFCLKQRWWKGSAGNHCKELKNHAP